MFEKEPSHPDHTITLTMRQLSLSIAALLAFGFFVFMSGYFLGHKRATQEFSYRADQESLADQIYSSMCILYDSKDEEETESTDEDQTLESDGIAESVEASPEISSEVLPEVSTSAITPEKQYRAVLSGFPASLIDNAKQMIARLNKKGYPVELVEHTSTHKKISKKWYQVVTKPYASREELEKIKPQLAKFGYVKAQSIDIV